MGSRVWEGLHIVKIQAFRNQGSHPRPLPLHLPTSTEKSPLLLTAEGTQRGSRAPATREGTQPCLVTALAGLCTEGGGHTRTGATNPARQGAA